MESISGWPVQVLSYLDQAAIYRQTRVAAQAVGSTLDGNLGTGISPYVPQVSLKVFQCPDDQSNFGAKQGLSYQVNGGLYRHTLLAIEFRGTPASAWLAVDETATVPTTRGYTLGVIFLRVPAGDRRMTLDYITQGDGASYTLLLAENSAGPKFRSFAAYPYPTLPVYYPGVDKLAFGVRVNPLDQPINGGVAGTLNGVSGYGGATMVTSLGKQAPNSTSPTDNIAVPSSNHNDIVHVAFTDGRATSINESINAGVYIRLITSNGQRLHEGVLDPGAL